MANSLTLDGSKSAARRQKRLTALQAQLPALVARVAAQGQQHAARGLQANVYGTAAGRYRRTGRLRGELFSSGQYAAGQLHLQLGDRAPYASLVEYGTGTTRITDPALQHLLAGLPPGGLLRLGRSGRAWMLPGPYLAPALAFARWRLVTQVQALMVRTFR